MSGETWEGCQLASVPGSLGCNDPSAVTSCCINFCFSSLVCLDLVSPLLSGPLFLSWNPPPSLLHSFTPGSCNCGFSAALSSLPLRCPQLNQPASTILMQCNVIPYSSPHSYSGTRTVAYSHSREKKQQQLTNKKSKSKMPTCQLPTAACAIAKCCVNSREAFDSWCWLPQVMLL